MTNTAPRYSERLGKRRARMLLRRRDRPRIRRPPRLIRASRPLGGPGGWAVPGDGRLHRRLCGLVCRGIHHAQSFSIPAHRRRLQCLHAVRTGPGHYRTADLSLGRTPVPAPSPAIFMQPAACYLRCRTGLPERLTAMNMPINPTKAASNRLALRITRG